MLHKSNCSSRIGHKGRCIVLVVWISLWGKETAWESMYRCDTACLWKEMETDRFWNVIPGECLSEEDTLDTFQHVTLYWKLRGSHSSELSAIVLCFMKTRDCLNESSYARERKEVEVPESPKILGFSWTRLVLSEDRSRIGEWQAIAEMNSPQAEERWGSSVTLRCVYLDAVAVYFYRSSLH